MTLSTADTTRLATLRTAYDKLLTGSKTVRVSSPDGSSVEYGQGDATRLKVEIDQLVAQSATCGRTRGALKFRI